MPEYAILNESKTVVAFVVCEADDTESLSYSISLHEGVEAVEKPSKWISLGWHYANNDFFPKSWILNSNTNSYEPSVDKPSDGREYRWHEDDSAHGWFALTPYPSWTWNEETQEANPPFYPPDRDNVYDWNEENQNWVPRS